jgi:AcrR family transcriptional regulator
MDFIRARTEEQIASRQAEIINACDVLYSRYGYEGVHFKAISEITSFKRSTIYSYYKTKDEVLLDLLKREMRDWAAALREKFDKTKTMTKQEFSAFLSEKIAGRKHIPIDFRAPLKTHARQSRGAFVRIFLPKMLSIRKYVCAFGLQTATKSIAVLPAPSFQRCPLSKRSVRR